MMSATIPQRQQGAALVIGLMILLLATFLAVASMNNANVQERMASNEQNSNKAFQAAESAVEGQIISATQGGDMSNFTAAHNEYKEATPTWPSATYDAGDTKISTSVEIRSLGATNISSGASIDADEGSVRIPGARFEVRATSTVAGSGARASIVQGLEYR